MAERVITFDQFSALLNAVDKTKNINPRWRRDKAILFLGFRLGLRVGEVVLLVRDCFSDLYGNAVLHIPTLKQSERVPFRCPAVVPDKENGGTKRCDRSIRVKADRIGGTVICPRCNNVGKVLKPKHEVFSGIALRDVDIVESQTVGAIEDYIREMPEGQNWLFPGRDPRYHISTSQVERLFATYAAQAGLSGKMSFHSLRHGRGTEIYSATEGDLRAVSDALRHKDMKSSERYAHMDSEAKDELRAKLEKNYARKMKNHELS